MNRPTSKFVHRFNSQALKTAKTVPLKRSSMILLATTGL